jgi:acyl-CoA thioesterase I
MLAILVLAGMLAIPALVPAPKVEASTPVAYIALGDSIAFGIGSSLPERRGYPVLLANLYSTYTGNTVAVHNLAVPGETAATFLSGEQVNELASAVQQLDEQGINIELVSISLGGNEILGQRYSGTPEREQALEAFQESLDAAVGRVRDEIGPEPTVILTTYYDLSDGDPQMATSDAWWIDRFNQAIVDVAGRHDGLVADIEPVFRDRIEELTLHPYDVHPGNQGYLAIARQLWSALGLDPQPPQVSVVSPTEVQRWTPTLQLDVTDESGVVRVTVLVEGHDTLEALHVGEDRYVTLVDLREHASDEVSITVEAEDAAGNVTRAETHIVITGQ